MKVVIGSDHGGFQLKEKLKQYIKEELKYECQDYGTYNEERCDYTDYALLVAEAVANNKCDVGIVVDGAGIGSAIMANKVPGVRAAVANEVFTAINSREHNGANVLTLGSFIVGEGVARHIVKAWLSTGLSGDRNIRRVNKITAFENRLNQVRGS